MLKTFNYYLKYLSYLFKLAAWHIRHGSKRSMPHAPKQKNRYGFLIGTMALIVLIPVSIFILKNAGQASADWFNDGWLYRKMLTIDNSTGSSQTIDTAVSQGSDDSEEAISTGNIDLASSDLELIQDPGYGDQEVGLRFQSLSIPAGSTITNAYIQFTADEAKSGTTNLTIYAEDADSASTFTTTNSDITNRTKTTASVSWSSIPAWNTVGAATTDERTPDISGLIQEVVDRGGWSSGNDMAFIFTGSGVRTAESYEGSSADAASLHVEYQSGGGAASNKRVKFDVDTASLISAGKMQSSCQDIRVTDQNGKLLRHYIPDTGDTCNTAGTDLWVLVEDIAAGIDTNLYLYYGNPTAPSTEESTQFSEAEFTPNSTSSGSEEQGPGPIAWWKLDEGYGTTANDSSDQGHEGTLAASTATPTWQTEDQCISAMCLKFDGSDDKLTVSDTISSIKTVSFWVKPLASSTSILELNGSVSISISSNAISTTGFTSPTVYVNGSPTTSVTANEWNHVSITTATGISGSAISLGNVSTSYLNGYLDEIKLFNFEKTAEGVKTDAVALAGPKGAGVVLGNTATYAAGEAPVGHWKLDENTGTNAYDRSGNNRAGTLTNSPAWIPGKFGSALQFTGSSSTFVDIGSGPSTIKTVTFWINPSTTTEYAIDLDGSNYIYLNSGTVTATGFTSPTIYVNGVRTSTVVANQWQHIAVTTNTAENASDLDLGRVEGSGYLTGSLDDVRLYDYARSHGQIVEDMNAGHPLGGSPIGSQTSYWKFDEAYGSTANNSTGSNNGTISTATWTNSGKFGSALSFSGSGTVQVDHDTSLDFDYNEPFSISTWFKTSSDQSATLVSKQDNASPYRGYNLQLGNNGYIFFQLVNTYSSSMIEVRTGDTSYDDNQWHHLIATYDGSGNASGAKIYLDGALQTLTTNNDSLSTNTISTTNPFHIGSRDGTAQHFTGSIDDVKVYSAALSASEVKIDYNANSAINFATGTTLADNQPDTDNPPLIYWDFNENTGTSAYDKGTAGSEHTGSIANAVFVPGKVGSALSFDGSGDYVLRTNSQLNSELATAGITVQAWINPKQLGDSAQWYLYQSHSSDPWNSFVIGNQTGDNDIYCVLNTNSASGSYQYSGSLTTNTWYHIACTWDGSYQRMFVNGIQVYEHSLTGDTILNASGDFTVGSGRYGNGSTSIIDEVKIYDYARTPGQIYFDFLRGKPKLHYKLDECQGTTAHDSGPFAVHGTITPGGDGNTSVGSCTTSGTTMWYTGRTGKRNASLDFDGTSDYISIPQTDSHSDIVRDKADASFTGWFKRNSSTTTDVILSKKNSTANSDVGYAVYISGTTDKLTFLTANGLDSFTVESSTTFTDSSWHHFAIVWDEDSTANTEIYIDGLADNATETGAIGNIGNLDNGVDFTIGAMNATTPTNYFDGQLDEIKMYGYALTPEGVRADMMGGTVYFGE